MLWFWWNSECCWKVIEEDYNSPVPPLGEEAAKSEKRMSEMMSWWWSLISIPLSVFLLIVLLEKEEPEEGWSCCCCFPSIDLRGFILFKLFPISFFILLPLLLFNVSLCEMERGKENVKICRYKLIQLIWFQVFISSSLSFLPFDFCFSLLLSAGDQFVMQRMEMRRSFLKDEEK